jgi:hypothetical protein
VTAATELPGRAMNKEDQGALRDKEETGKHYTGRGNNKQDRSGITSRTDLG